MHTFSRAVKQLMVTSVPVAASGILNVLASLISMVFVAQLGRAELAASAIAVQTFITVTTLSATLLYSVSILMRYAFAQGLKEEAGAVFQNATLLMFVLWVPTVLILWYSPAILTLLHQDPQLVAMSMHFFHWSAWLALPFLVNGLMNQFLLAVGKTRIIFAVSLVRLPCMVLLAYGLVLGRMGLPKMGLAGLACAQTFVQGAAALCMTLYYRRYRAHHLALSTRWNISWSTLKKLLHVGGPIGVQFGGELASFTAVMYMMGLFGVTALAASRVVGQYNMVTIMIMLAFSQGFSVCISEAYAKRDFPLAQTYHRAMLVIWIVLSVAVFSVFCFTGTFLMRLYFNPDLSVNQDMARLASSLFVVGGFRFMFDSARNILSGGLRGLQASAIPMRIGLGCIALIGLPSAYVLGVKLFYGPVALSSAFLSGFFVSTIFLWRRYHQKWAVLSAENGSVQKIV